MAAIGERLCACGIAIANVFRGHKPIASFVSRNFGRCGTSDMCHSSLLVGLQGRHLEDAFKCIRCYDLRHNIFGIFETGWLIAGLYDEQRSFAYEAIVIKMQKGCPMSCKSYCSASRDGKEMHPFAQAVPPTWVVTLVHEIRNFNPDLNRITRPLAWIISN